MDRLQVANQKKREFVMQRETGELAIADSGFLLRFRNARLNRINRAPGFANGHQRESYLESTVTRAVHSRIVRRLI